MIERMSETACAGALAELNGWTLEPDRKAIVKTFEFRGFLEAFAFMTQVALIAERNDHHPEWTNVHRLVRIRLTTHDACGLSARDFTMAAAIDGLRSVGGR